MTDIDEHGRPEPPSAADEKDTLVGFLDYQRATFAWKTSGLDQSGMRVKVAASSMTLGGMVKHLALVEDYWLSQWLFDRDMAPEWEAVDWEKDPNWEWRTGAEETPDQLHARWEAAVAASRVNLDAALAQGGLDQLAKHKGNDGRSPSLRWILVHMIEEYARHNGHADLIRESIDGETGE